MITQNNPSMNSTAEAIFKSTANDDILEQCRIREDNIAHELYQNELIKTLSDENKVLTDTVAKLQAELDVLKGNKI